MTTFSIVTQPVVEAMLAGAEQAIVDCVRDAYVRHGAGATVNPDSSFLRFPDKPNARIIALPAFLGAESGTAGIKWISSFPDNVAQGRQRASAVLILNDYETGHPVALLAAAAISAARTAASAALAAQLLTSRAPSRVGVVGCGYLARTICRFVRAGGTPMPVVRCHDLSGSSAEALVGNLREADATADAAVAGLDEALDADLVILATTALKPYVPAQRVFRAGQVVLNISLRDLAPEILLRADNVLDDVDHCLKQHTSPHLAELATGGRAFVTGTITDAIHGTLSLDPNRPSVFSPFGLGVLDLAVGRWTLDRARAAGRTVELPDFLGDQVRW